MKLTYLLPVLAGTVALVSGCGTANVNTAYYKDGQWNGVSGPAEVQSYLVCANANARGSQAYAEQISDTLAPTVFNALHRNPETGVKVLPMEGDLCQELGALVGGNFEVTPPLAKALRTSFAECNCESLVVPISFVNYEQNTSEVRDSAGRTVATMNTGGIHASGGVANRILVFTKGGGLAFNGYAQFMSWEGGRSELRHEAQRLTQEMLQNFPGAILSPPPTMASAPAPTVAAVVNPPPAVAATSMDCSTAKKTIESQFRAIQSGASVDVVKACFTARQRDKITPEVLSNAKTQLSKVTLEQLYASEVTHGDAIQVKGKTGRTLTTLVKEGGVWKADTLWFK